MEKEINNLLYNIATNNISGVPNTLVASMLKENARRHRLKPSLMRFDPKIEINDINWEEYKIDTLKKDSEFCRLLDKFNENNVEYIVIKGIAMKYFYHRDVPRQSSDYDIIVKDIESYNLAVEICKNLGYEINGFPFFTNTSDKIAGMTRIVKELDKGTSIDCELNLGGFWISEITILDDTDLWENQLTVNYLDTEIVIPSKEICMLILIGEISSNSYKRIRDLVDFYYINKSHLDWQFINEKLDYYKLHKEYKRIKKELREMEEGQYKSTKINKFSNLLWNISRNIFHVIPKLLGNVRLANIMRYYLLRFIEGLNNRDKLMFIVIKFDKLLSSDKNFDIGIPINFIPLDVPISGDWKVIKIDNKVIIRTHMGVFFGSNFCIHAEEEISLVEEIAKESFLGV